MLTGEACVYTAAGLDSHFAVGREKNRASGEGGQASVQATADFATPAGPADGADENPKGVSLVLVDVITERSANLLDLIGQWDQSLGAKPPAIYAVACRWIRAGGWSLGTAK